MRTGIIDGIVGTPIKVEVNPDVNVEIVTPPEVTDALLCIKWTLIVIAVLLLLKLIKGNK
jgi:hypothetical protein